MFAWFKRSPLTLEAWSTKHQNKCSPEDLIVAHVISEIAKDPRGFIFTEMGPTEKRNSDKWVEEKDAGIYEHSWEKCTGFQIQGRNIEVSSWLWRRARDRDGTNPWIYWRELPTVNGVQISVASARIIRDRYKELLMAHEKLEATAAKAKQEMEINEQQWNLAEKFLGMKRNGLGALVPVEQGEKSCEAKQQQRLSS